MHEGPGHRGMEGKPSARPRRPGRQRDAGKYHPGDGKPDGQKC